MATHTLKQIYQQTPEMDELIDNFHELVPDVPASSGNLECLLKDIKNGGKAMFEKQGDEADQGVTRQDDDTGEEAHHMCH